MLHRRSGGTPWGEDQTLADREAHIGTPMYHALPSPSERLCQLESVDQGKTRKASCSTAGLL